MFNFDYVAIEDIKEHNPNWSERINSIETYAHGTSKGLIYHKEKNKQFSIIKTIPKCLTLIMSQMKT